MYLAMGSIAVGVFFQSLFHIFVKEDNLNCCEEELDVTVSGENVKISLIVTDHVSWLALPARPQPLGHADNWLATAKFTPKIAISRRQMD